MRMVHVAMINILATPIIAQIGCTLQILNENPLDLVQADGVVGAVIQLRRARRLVVRDLLRMLNCTTILQVRRNAGRTTLPTTMPVARKVWQQVVIGSLACRARRLITPHLQTPQVDPGVASTSSRCSRRSAKWRSRFRLRKSGPFRSAGICADLRWDAV
jgi:hypothetical protein